MKEPRSHIEGGDARRRRSGASAGRARSVHAAGAAAHLARTARSRSPTFINPDTIEWHLDRVFNLEPRSKPRRPSKDQPNVLGVAVSSSSMRPSPAIRRSWNERAVSTRLWSSGTEDLKAKAKDWPRSRRFGWRRARPGRGRPAVLAADHGRDDVQRLSDDQGQGRRAGLRRDPGDQPPDRQEFEGDVFPIKEYYTNSVQLPAWILAGSGGALRIQIRCLTPTQYLGMAESDLYLLATSGNFGFNYMKGLFGVWLQAMV